MRDALLKADVRALLAVPLLREEQIVGTLMIRRRTRGAFGKSIIDLMQSFASQSALAIQNARLFREIEDKSRQLESASQHKSQFLANMSHELRTPLNAIGGYAELMEMGIRGPVTAEQREDLRRIKASQRHLLGLINEVLQYAKLETGAVQYDLTDVPVRDALSAAETLVAPQARAKGLLLVVEESPLDVVVRADPEKLRQILVNLIGNAI
jgi:signal transduction histidine kinase